MSTESRFHIDQPPTARASFDLQKVRQMLIEASRQYQLAHNAGDSAKAEYWDGALRMGQRICDLVDE